MIIFVEMNIIKMCRKGIRCSFKFFCSLNNKSYYLTVMAVASTNRHSFDYVPKINSNVATQF